MENFIQEFIIGIFLTCSIIVTTIYCIVYNYNNDNKEKTQEDNERNKSEVVLWWINLIVCIVAIVAFFGVVIVDSKVKYFENVKTLTNLNIILLVLSLICIVSTSTGWDYFSRESDSCVQRRIFICLTFIGVLLFLKILDSFHANRNGCSSGIPFTFSSDTLRCL